MAPPVDSCLFAAPASGLAAGQCGLLGRPGRVYGPCQLRGCVRGRCVRPRREERRRWAQGKITTPKTLGLSRRRDVRPVHQRDARAACGERLHGKGARLRWVHRCGCPGSRRLFPSLAVGGTQSTALSAPSRTYLARPTCLLWLPVLPRRCRKLSWSDSHRHASVGTPCLRFDSWAPTLTPWRSGLNKPQSCAPCDAQRRMVRS